MTDEAAPEQKHPGGRPTKYDPAYCEMVIEFMGQGYSLTAFAGSIVVARSTINEWIGAHPEFSEAVKIGQAARTAKLEEGLLSADQGPKVTARIFALKNAAPDEWADTTKTELTGRDGGPIEVKAAGVSGLLAAVQKDPGPADDEGRS